MSRTIPGRLLRQTLLVSDPLKNKRIDWPLAQHQFRKLNNIPPVVLHEAAHTVIAWMSQTVWAVLRVSVSPLGNVSGYCVSIRPLPMCEPTLWEDISCSVSGMAAERIIRPNHNPIGSDYDAELILEMAIRLGKNSKRPWNRDEAIPIPDVVWENELWRARDHQQIVGACYRRSLALLTSNMRGFTKLCHRLQKVGSLHTPGIFLILGRRPVVGSVSVLAAQALDTALGLPSSKEDDYWVPPE